MTKDEREEAIAIIRKEYLCVDRDCDIEKSCGKCDLMMPSKEPILKAYKTAIQALEQEQCEDAIRRSEAIKAIDEREDVNGKVDAESVRTDIVLMPPVTPQPKTGHWVKTISENGITSAVRCSNCGFEDNRYMLFRYCPNCGCRMVEPQERSGKE